MLKLFTGVGRDSSQMGRETPRGAAEGRRGSLASSLKDKIFFGFWIRTSLISYGSALEHGGFVAKFSFIYFTLFGLIIVTSSISSGGMTLGIGGFCVMLISFGLLVYFGVF